MSTSILLSIKKLLGIEESYEAFDVDIQIHINSAFSTLHQLGVGPVEGFYITGKEETWEDFIQEKANIEQVKSYVYIKVRLLFDPPSNSFALDSLANQAKEFEWRLNVQSSEPVPTIPEGES